MKNVFLRRTLTMFSCMFMVFSCSPEDGEDGAIGPEGPQGIPGMDGNANVIVSDWINVEYDVLDSSTVFFILNDNQIADDVLNSSVVLLYARTSDGFVVGVPWIENFTNTAYTYSLLPNQIEFVARTLDNTAVAPVFIQIRYAIIPATTDVSSIANQKYGELMERLGLDL